MHTDAAAKELYDPLSHTPAQDVYDVYEVLRKAHPVYHNAQRDVWCISRFADVQAAARNWQGFSNANGIELDAPTELYGPGNFLEDDPPRHDVLRKVVRPFFVPKAIAELEVQIAQRVADLIDNLKARDEVDLAQDFAWALPIWVICRLLGVPPSDDELIHSLVNSSETRHAGEEEPTTQAIAAVRELQAYSRDLAAEKRKRPGNDLMSHLVDCEKDDAPLAEEIPGIAVLTLTAGSETTASLIGNTLDLLDRHPSVQARLRSEPASLIESVIEESLRFESPVQYLARQTTTPITVEDVEIPEKADVILLYGSANRDERHFGRADQFDPAREPRRHLAFGEGIHFCLGAPLARLEARVAVPALLGAFSSFSLTQPGERLLSHVIRGFTHLPATLATSSGSN